MNTDTNNDIETLKRQVQELMDWKKAREQRQLTYPLDVESKEILSKDVPVLKEIVTYYGGAGSYSQSFYLSRVDDKDVAFSLTSQLRMFTVNTTTNTITANLPGVVNDNILLFYSTQTLPGGLDSVAIDYWVINVSGNTFQVSATSGGAAIDITSDGVGNHYLEVIA